jgi:hypothetical protein
MKVAGSGLWKIDDAERAIWELRQGFNVILTAKLLTSVQICATMSSVMTRERMPAKRDHRTPMPFAIIAPGSALRVCSPNSF